MRMIGFLFMTFILAVLDFSAASASPAGALTKAIARFFTKQAAEEGAERITREVSAEVVERVSAKVLREGGESLVSETTELAARHGPEIVRALDNAPSPGAIINALNQLSDAEIPVAASRLAGGTRGKALAQATDEFGADVLRSEIQQPGVGLEIVRTWPKQGSRLCRALQRDEAITLGKYLDDLSTVPLKQRNQLQEIISANPPRFFTWLKRFIEKNPGKSIGSVTFLAAFIPNAERILGGDEIVLDASGEHVVIRKPGVLSAPTERLTGTIEGALAWLLGGGVALLLIWFARWLGIHRGWISPRKGF
ncbi:MAG: hypothetical protein ACIALR_00740 [Blastopirellula sp. JB062]